MILSCKNIEKKRRYFGFVKFLFVLRTKKGEEIVRLEKKEVRREGFLGKKRRRVLVWVLERQVSSGSYY